MRLLTAGSSVQAGQGEPKRRRAFCRRRFLLRVFSSVGQSSRLITGWSRVRVPEDPPNKKDAIWRLFYLVGLQGLEPWTNRL